MAAHPLRFHCAAGLAARCLKWGKTGNHFFFLVGDLCGFNPSAATTQRACSSPATHQKIVSEKKYRYSNQSHPAASSSAALPPPLPPAAPSRRQAPPSSSSSRRERACSPQMAPAASSPCPSDAERASGRVRCRHQPDIPQHEEGGEIVARWGQSTLLTAVRGGESPARGRR